MGGMVQQIHGITDDEVTTVIQQYRKDFPEDKRTDEELWPEAVNYIWANGGGGHYPEPVKTNTDTSEIRKIFKDIYKSI